MAATYSSGTSQHDTAVRASLGTCLLALAQRYGVAGFATGSSLAGLEATSRERAAALRAARVAGLRTQRRTVTWADLPRLAPQGPAIVSFRDGSCLILAETRVVDGTPVAMLEHPGFAGRAPLLVDRVRFEKVWTGEVILVRPAVGRGGAARPFGWSLVRELVRREGRLVGEGIAATLALAVLAAAPILFVQLLLLRVLPARADRSLLILGVGLAVVLVAEGVLRAVRAYLAARLAARTQARLATVLFDRLLGMPVGAIESLAAGDLKRRVDDLAALGTGLAGLVPRLALDVGVLLVVGPLMLDLDLRLTLAALTVTALVVTGLVAARPRLRHAAARSVEAQARRSAFLDQTLGRIGAVKGLALIPDRVKQWDRQTAALGHAQLAEGRIGDGLQTLAVMAERVLVLGTLTLGLALSTSPGGGLAVAPLIAMVLFVQRLAAPLPTAVAMLRAEAAASIAVERLAAVLKQPVEQASGARDAVVTQGAIAFEQVEFTYPAGGVPALHRVSFAVPAGTTLGIMGRSGAGKSTIVRLLQRLHMAQDGVVRLDGFDVRDFDPDRLRGAVASVPQTSTILAGTIRETLTAAKPEATFEEMVRAARLAGADDFIEHLPRGYETLLHEGAPTLSAGQRQRLALARALITEPRILILDEALSALDPEIEAVVETNLREARRGLTTIIVTHRLTALMGADAILVMQEGAVVDIGRHRELLDRCDAYAAAWMRQPGALEGDGAEPVLALS